MSNDITTNNFEELTFPSLLKKYDKILIPMIQRDYAQGRSDEKAQEVRTNLLKDIFEKESVHFDLIFGSCEKRKENNGEKQCFIPVDGQQRLTTLFLLHLYAQKLGRNDEELDLSKFSYDTRRAAADFCNKVTAEPWIVEPNKKVSETIKDSVWFMNYWENDPTVEGMLNMLDAIHDKANETKGIDFPNLDKIKFYFFDLESNGLNENLYLKMNSRGKPLTAFENLKASIEKVLPDNLESDGAQKCFPENVVAPESFKDKWKFFMDRDWTNAFWNSEKPEVTDNNITAFIVRFLSGYYNAFSNSNDENVLKETDKLKEINIKSNYADFIPFEPIRESLQLPKAFQRLALAFTTIVNKEEIKPNWNETIKATDFHEYKIIAVIFAYVLFYGNTQAMRVAWNLAENIVSGYDNYIAYCKRIGEIYSYYEENEDDIYIILAKKEFKNPSAQLTEEIVKAKQILDEDGKLHHYEGSHRKEDGSIYQTWEEIIIDAEKHAFFKGAIRFLFQNAEGKADDWNNFDIKWGNAQKYFDENGVSKSYRKTSILLRALLSRIDISERWFGNHADFWHNTLLNSDTQFLSAVHYLLSTKDLEVASNCGNWIRDDKLLEILLGNYDSWHILNNWRNYSVITRYSRRESNPLSPKEIVVLNPQRNNILQSPGVSIKEDCFIGSGNYLYGWNIDFKFKNFFFRWFGNPNDKELDVYLMEEKWNDYKKRANPTTEKNTEEDEWYCFRVTPKMEEDTTLFTKELDRLIDEAKQNGDLQAIEEQ